MQVLITGNPWLDMVFSTHGLAIIGILVALWLMRSKRNVPGPRGLPIIGNALEVAAQRATFLDWLWKLHKKYGHTFTFSVLNTRFIAITQPEDVDYMLKSNFENFVKGARFNDNLHELLGYGIFNVDGNMWKVQRKQASHMFSVNSFRNHMTEVFNRNGLEVVKLLDAAARSGEVVDLQAIFFRFTLDSVGEISFGSNINSLKDPSVPFSNAFDHAQAVAEKRFWDPLWKIKRAFNMGGEKALKASVKIMNDFSADIITRRRAEPEAERAQRCDLLSRFMALKGNDGKPLSDNFLRDIIMNFMIAGRDTTANAMSWACYRLAIHPEVTQKVLAEVKDLPAEPDYDTVKALEYTRALFTETLRLHPSVPKDGAEAASDCTLPSGARVKKLDYVMFMPYIMGRMPSLWGDDCLEFKPERFIGKPEPPASKFIAFKAGPRLCLGKSMAYFEAASLLSKIVQKFTLELEEGFEPHYAPSVTLPMRDGLRVRVKRR